MRRLFSTALSALLFTAILSGTAAAAGNVNLFLGGKALDEDDWEPVEDQGAFGVQVDFEPKGWPVALDVGIRFSGEEEDVFVPGLLGNVDITGATMELTAGVKKIWEVGPVFRPYLGAGLALVSARLEVDTPSGDVDDEDSGIGVYATAGAYVTLGRHFNLGADFRYSHAKVDLFGETVDAGGFHSGLLLGYHW